MKKDDEFWGSELNSLLYNVFNLFFGSGDIKNFIFYYFESFQRICGRVFLEASADPEILNIFYDSHNEVSNKIQFDQLTVNILTSLGELEFATQLFELAESYERQGKLEQALVFYIKMLQMPANQITQECKSEARYRMALIWSERLDLLNKAPNNDPALCFSLASYFFNKGQFTKAYRLSAVAVECYPRFKDTYLAKDLLAKFPEKPPEISEDEPLLSRIDIIEYILPFYESAATSGHEKAGHLLNDLQNELITLKDLKEKFPKWDPSLIRNLSKVNDDEELLPPSNSNNLE